MSIIIEKFPEWKGKTKLKFLTAWNCLNCALYLSAAFEINAAQPEELDQQWDIGMNSTSIAEEIDVNLSRINTDPVGVSGSIALMKLELIGPIVADRVIQNILDEATDFDVKLRLKNLLINFGPKILKDLEDINYARNQDIQEVIEAIKTIERACSNMQLAEREKVMFRMFSNMMIENVNIDEFSGKLYNNKLRQIFIALAIVEGLSKCMGSQLQEHLLIMVGNMKSSDKAANISGRLSMFLLIKMEDKTLESLKSRGSLTLFDKYIIQNIENNKQGKLQFLEKLKAIK